MVERSSLLQLFIPENKRNVERFNSWPNEFNDLQHVKSKGSLVTSILNNNNNNNNLFLIRRKLTSEYDQMRLTTITTCNNYNKIYLKNT